MIALLSSWRHSGFQVYCGPRIFPQDEIAMENLARYILRASSAPTSRRGRSRWLGTEDSAKLFEPKVQIVILTPISNRPSCTCRFLTGARIAMHKREKDWLEKSLKPLPPGVTLWGKIFAKIMAMFMPLVHISATDGGGPKMRPDVNGFETHAF